MKKLKYIIAGLHGTGKSTLIDLLEKKGYVVIKEVSRSVIINEQNAGKDGMPWRDVERFNKLVLEETICRLKLNPNASFCDRSLIDNIAYLKYSKKNIPKELKNFPFKETYQKLVFFALPWEEIYVQDEQRPQPFDPNSELNQILIESYQERGFELVVLPFSTIDKRVEFILEKIKTTIL